MRLYRGSIAGENYLWLCVSGSAESAELPKTTTDVVEDSIDAGATTAALTVRTSTFFVNRVVF
jgi:hypothetical protein